MRAGKLTERISFQRFPVEDGDKNETGEFDSVAYTYASRWASVVALNAKESIAANQVVGTTGYKIQLHPIRSVKATDQILWKGITLQISAPPITDSESTTITATARE